MFGQTFEPHDLAVIGILIILEGILSIDNALVLGLLAKRLPRHLRGKALSYGLIGAFVFRLIAVILAAWLIQIRWVKLVGGLYLLYVAGKHFLTGLRPAEKGAVHVTPEGVPVNCENGLLDPTAVNGVPRVGERYHFWSTVASIELTDIAFAVDSILAAVGLVRGRSKTWVVITGGMLGVILMRFAAALFIRILEKFPRFEVSAYLLVTVIGAKLALDWGFNPDPHHPRLDFHHPTTIAFWVFWGSMLACFLLGFLPRKKAA